MSTEQTQEPGSMIVLGLPDLPVKEKALELRCHMGTGDWHCRTKSGWWYLDGRSKRQWVPSGYGPTCW